MTERDSAEFRSYETHTIYPNLNAILLSDQQKFRLNKINRLKIILLQRLKKNN